MASHRTGPVLRDKKYLDWLVTQPCLFTGMPPHDGESVVPAHIGTLGKGLKSPDDEALPVRNEIHQAMHRGEITALRTLTPDWLIRAAFRALARELYQRWKTLGPDACTWEGFR